MFASFRANLAFGNPEALASLFLNGRVLTRTIPEAVGNLTVPAVLHLDSNALTETIPEAIGSLRTLHQSSNALTETIPEDIGNLTALMTLSPSTGGLTGTIPEAIGNLTALTRSNLANNALTGTIPEMRTMRAPGGLPGARLVTWVVLFVESLFSLILPWRWLILRGRPVATVSSSRFLWCCNACSTDTRT